MVFIHRPTPKGMREVCHVHNYMPSPWGCDTQLLVVCRLMPRALMPNLWGLVPNASGCDVQLLGF